MKSPIILLDFSRVAGNYVDCTLGTFTYPVPNVQSS